MCYSLVYFVLNKRLLYHPRVWYFDFVCVPKCCPVGMKMHYDVPLFSVSFSLLDLNTWSLDLNLNYKAISTE